MNAPARAAAEGDVEWADRPAEAGRGEGRAVGGMGGSGHQAAVPSAAGARSGELDRDVRRKHTGEAMGVEGKRKRERRIVFTSPITAPR